MVVHPQVLLQQLIWCGEKIKDLFSHFKLIIQVALTICY